ncbi:hypothetical protein D3C81_1814920 [compost metagenome]
MRAAAALITRLLGELANDGKRALRGQGQKAVFILQQHHALPGHFARQTVMLLRFKRNVLLTVLHPFVNKAKQPLHRKVQRLHGQLAAVHGGNDFGTADPSA